MHPTQIYVQLVAAIAGVRQLNAVLSGWEFPIGSRQWLLQTVARQVTSCTVALKVNALLYIIALKVNALLYIIALKVNALLYIIAFKVNALLYIIAFKVNALLYYCLQS